MITRKARTLTPDEYIHLLAAIPEQHRLMVETLIEAGLRWGELVALKPRHIDFLRRSLTGASLRILEMLTEADDLRARLRHNAALFRRAITDAGFDVLEGEHPIVPVMIGDVAEAGAMVAALFHRGIYVTAFSYPVVPLGKARIRVQLSASHTSADVAEAVLAFDDARAEVAGRR